MRTSKRRLARRLCASLVLLACGLGPLAPGRVWAAPPGAVAAPSEVQASLDAFDAWVKSQGGTLSALVQDTASLEILAERNADSNLNAASNVKLVTAAVALSRLGPSYRFVTGLYGVVQQGEIDALVLRGNGDPSLELGDLWRLAAELQQRGVRKVRRLLVDQSRFDAEFVPPAFEQQPEEWAAFRAPVAAVSLERNSVTLVVVPTQAKQPAQVWFEPPGVVAASGVIETRARGSGQNVQLSLTPSATGLAASLGGHVAQGLPPLRFARRLDDPRRAAGLALARALNALGVSAPDSVELGGAERHELLALHESAPLTVLVQELGKNSDNFYAEMLLKAVGAAASNAPGKSADGVAAARAWLVEAGAWTDDMLLSNGSGLFASNRLSARALTTVLVRASLDPSIAPDFVAQLAIGGVDGTLRSRFAEWAASRRIRAKTGTLARASCLSGYVLGARGEAPVAFSLLVNGIAGQAFEIRRRQDELVSRIARRKPSAPAKAPAAAPSPLPRPTTAP